jgi:hypothetical protein
VIAEITQVSKPDGDEPLEGRGGGPIRIAWAMADQSDTRHEIRNDGISRSDLVDCDAQSS